MFITKRQVLFVHHLINSRQNSDLLQIKNNKPNDGVGIDAFWMPKCTEKVPPLQIDDQFLAFWKHVDVHPEEKI